MWIAKLTTNAIYDGGFCDSYSSVQRWFWLSILFCVTYLDELNKWQVMEKLIGTESYWNQAAHISKWLLLNIIFSLHLKSQYCLYKSKVMTLWSYKQKQAGLSMLRFQINLHMHLFSEPWLHTWNVKGHSAHKLWIPSDLSS